MAERAKIEKFYSLWILEQEKLINSYVYDGTGNLNPTRHKFFHYVQLLERFLNEQIDEIEKINILSGIRGVGKTTLLGQLYFAPKFISKSQ
ncbi:MAG: hypothetical protein CVT88_07225 [Candidatus Altiarchaeales archaeon HGW-Altiarchaeales-1]|nr:MAG: hypothetical protein CVT88_07225 [Candidatus Altiarchaeales archaeon HGW-Altiarchaeales-1]